MWDSEPIVPIRKKPRVHLKPSRGVSIVEESKMRMESDLVYRREKTLKELSLAQLFLKKRLDIVNEMLSDLHSDIEIKGLNVPSYVVNPLRFD